MEKRVEVNAEELSRIKQLINEAESLLEKRKLKTSVEKLYEAAKEVIILLARKYNLDEIKEAEKRGGWDFELVDKTVDVLYRLLGRDVLGLWFSVVHLKLASEDKILNKRNLQIELEDIKKMIESLLAS